MNIKKFLLGLGDWIKKNPLEFSFLLAILLVGAFLRLYRIDEYMTFLGDEGRDVIIVRRIFTELHPPLIGPGTSVGGMYLGPLYYYMMALPLLLSGFSPVGPAVMVALLGVATIFFIWFVGKKWFGNFAGLIAGGLYAVSPVPIIFSHSSWNPNIMPFFSLLCVYAIWKVWKENKLNWLVVMGISFAFVLQSHYLGLLLAPTLFLFWIITLIKEKSKKVFIQKSILGLISFLLLMSPLLIFDLRHDFMNAKAFNNFLVNRDSTVSINLFESIKKVPETFNLITRSLIGAKNTFVSLVLSIFLSFATFWFLLTKRFKDKSSLYLIIAWILFATLGLSFYKLSIYDHYLGFVFVVPYILIGILLSKFSERGRVFKGISILIVLLLVILNLMQNPFRHEPNRLLKRSQDVAGKILSLDNDKPFNLAVIADNNYEDGYEYYLYLWGGRVLNADINDASTITDQLFVICEREETKCDPTHSPKAEVANFGMSEIENKWSVDGVIIYKLIHTK